MTTPDTAAIRAQMETLDGFTPGPWDWEVSRRSQTVELCGGKGASDLTVMSFARWGLNKAAPVFWFWRGNVSDEPKRAEALGTPEPGREHHADWFQRINHPDARLIAAAPDMRETILAICDAVEVERAENERRQAALVEIAHTFTERADRTMKSCSASFYQEVARAASRRRWAGEHD